MDIHEYWNSGAAALAISTGIACFGILVGPPLLLGIIRYKQFGIRKNRTLLTLLTPTICWINIWQLYLIRTLEVIHFTLGPLPEPVCCFKVTAKVFIISMTILQLDAYVVTRYVLIFCLKNPLSINDTFWNKVITLCTAFLSIIAAATGAFVSSCKKSAFGICNNHQTEPISLDVSLIYFVVLIIGSLLLHLVVKIRIWVHEREVKVFPENQLVLFKSTIVKEMKKTEMWVFSAVFFIFIVFLILIDNPGFVSAAEDMAHDNFATIFVHLAAPVILMFALVLLFYRQKALRTFVWVEIKSLFS